LALVFRSADWRIYELRPAVPILTGPARARISELGHDRIAGWTAATGDYRLRVNYTAFWRATAGNVCVKRADDGMTVLRARDRGRFVLSLKEQPVRLVASAIGRRRSAC
jgi:hypothetical protein